MRIIVLTNGSIYSNIIIQELLKKYKHDVVSIICSDCIIYKMSKFNSLLFISKYSGYYFLWTKLYDKFKKLTYEIFCKIYNKNKNVLRISKIAKQYKIPLYFTNDLNNKTDYKRLIKSKPDLILSISFNQILNEKIINSATYGVINIHPSLLPEYSGLMPYFWVLLNNENKTGVTLHWVDSKIDTGKIIYQDEVSIDVCETMSSLAYKLSIVGADIVNNALESLNNNKMLSYQQNKNQRTYYSWPTKYDIKRFKQDGKKFGCIYNYL